MREKQFQLYGIFGCPLAHTLSPAMQEAAFKAAGLKAFYVPLELSERGFKKTMSALPKLALNGFNLTVPYKQTVIPYLKGRFDAGAKALGAVNTVYRRGGKWNGANTDVYGFITSLKADGKFDPRRKKALVLGAGGAGRAVVYALAQAGAAAVWIANRNPERARKLARDFKKFFPRTTLLAVKLTAPALKSIVAEADLVVNATSVGLKPGPSALPGALVAGGRKKLFYDLIYHRSTEFMAAARRKGHRAVGGLGMLLFQGAKAFEYWTGKKAPVGVMKKALEEALRERHKWRNFLPYSFFSLVPRREVF